MATIRERGPYQWQAQILRKGQSPQYKTFNNKSDAEKWARSIEAEMDRGAFVSRKEAENTMLAEALDRYEREITSKKKGHQEKNTIRKWKNHSLSKRPLTSIQGKDVAEYRDERLKNVSPNTVRLELALLSHLFTIAVKEWGMSGLVNPVMQIRKPKLPQGRDRRLQSGELDAICAASESPVLADLVRFAGEAGMRRGELAGMTWQMVDLQKRTVTLLETKNGEKRLVPLSTEAVRILTGLVRRIDGKVWGMEPDSITQAFIRALSRARTAYEKDCEEKGEKPDTSFLADLTFHDLRHEATSRFFEKGLNPMQVA
ncbi:MAG: tyrosine-type recombinase/integrase, partial [Nitrospiraceae bacterium]|nr:tyrosine-type recombinase/integrase [Nitrospiraceae bacterium]